MDHKLIVALGEARYEVERPWGAWSLPGKVTDIACGPGGLVFVLVRGDPYVEAEADCVIALDGDGRFLRSWGAGRIVDAHKIACDPHGLVWVVDRDAHEIVAFDTEGREVRTLGVRHRPLSPFNHPSDIAFGDDGTIAVADGYGGGKVHVLAQDGSPIAGFGKVGTEPGSFLTVHGIWITPEGMIVVADRENNRLQVFHPDGRLERVLDAFHRPSDIWGNGRGDLYVSDGVPTLTRLGPGLEPVGRCRAVLNGAHGISGDAAGRIYLAEGNPSRISRLVPVK